MRARGKVGTQGRFSIPKKIRDKMGINEETFFEIQTAGSHKLIITLVGNIPKEEF